MSIFGITSLPRREGSAARRAKSSRATEAGIAGHQAAMKALSASVKVEPNVVDRHKPTKDF
jgi:hypothetical protein